MKATIRYTVLSALLSTVPAFAEVDCLKLSLFVKQAASSEQSKVLEAVAKEVAAAPDCACEIVKAAIEGSSADANTVAAIVEAAATAAPEQMRLISQCAVAVAPDALVNVQAVMAKLDPNLGESGTSAKSSKSSKAPAGEVAAIPNPLDFPGVGPVGPTIGGPGGFDSIPLVVQIPSSGGVPITIVNPAGSGGPTGGSPTGGSLLGSTLSIAK